MSSLEGVGMTGLRFLALCRAAAFCRSIFWRSAEHSCEHVRVHGMTMSRSGWMSLGHMEHLAGLKSATSGLLEA